MTDTGIDIPGYEGRAARLAEGCVFRVAVVVTACSVDLPVEGIEPICGKSTPLRIQVV